jgi:lysophospholipase L1-like esterase
MRRPLLAVLLVSAAFAQTDFYLKSADRVVFYGDSITDQRLYTTFTETFVVTRFPTMNVTFTHSGWGGDRVTGGGGGPIDVRLERDVFPYRPTVVSIMLGMNDGSYRAFDKALYDTYCQGMAHIVQSLKDHAPGVRITLIEPSPYDDVTRSPNFQGGYNEVLVKYGECLLELGAMDNLLVADLNTAVVAALRRANAADPQQAAKLIPDRVHPGAGGHLLMSAELLKAWKAPALVSSVTIDAVAGKSSEVKNASVTGVKNETSLQWDETEKALPMALDLKDKLVKLAIDSSDYLDRLDQEELRVTGLKAGNYALTIDGVDAGTYAAEDLAKGINLAAFDTPMLRQAMDVHALTLKHNNIHFSRWRTLQVPMAAEPYPSKEKAMSDLDTLEREIVDKQRAAAQPMPHHFELTARP